MLVTRGFAASAIGLTLALVACGGGDEPTSTGFTEPPPLTRAEFLREADRICFATESQIEAAVDDYAKQPDPDPDEVRRVVDKVVVPALRSEARAIGLLDPPPEDAEEVEAILDATRAGADALAADPVAAIDRPPEQLLEAERLARRYGSEECGLRGL
jgi:hypothetical protein